ncbi:hypothetical protein Tco_0443065, partial [Tanacetum coccineum]
MQVFIGNMCHIMDFNVLKSIEANIDPSLSQVVFGRPFAEIACLAINRKHGWMTFTDGSREVTFKTSYKDPERSELTSKGHDLLSSRIILSEDDYDRGFPTGRYVVPTGRVIATVSIKVPTGRYIVPAGYIVMAISVISVSSDSSEESLGTPAGRVILFCTIPTTIPDTTPTIYPATTHTDTTMTPTKIPTVLPTVLLTVPPSPDHTPALPDITPASHDYSPASDTESDPSKDPLSDHIPPLQAILPFLSSADDTTDSDTPDTPPLPTH